MKKSGYERAFARLIVACGVALLNHAIAQEASPPNFGVQKNDQPDRSDPNFSSPGGVYQASFNLVLSCTSLGTSVIYTTDGTLPSLKNGTRTEAGKPALLRIGKSFQRIPSVSLVMAHEDLFGPKGIYLNSKESGDGWEKPCSFEWIKPKGKGSDQVNCGVEIQGSSSRIFSPKHGFQLAFKSKYGPKKFKGRIFPESSVKKFDSLVLRSPTHDSWAVANPELRKNARYVNDAWAADTQRLMGHLSPQHRWVHLFLNGFYWGIYAIVESSTPTLRPWGSF